MKSEQFNTLLSIVVSILGLAGMIYGGAVFIDSRVDRSLTAPQVLHRIALAARPRVIFDSIGTIHLDQGAMAHFEDIRVEKGDDGLLSRVIVVPKHYLNGPPLLTALDHDLDSINVARGEKFNFVYSLGYKGPSTFTTTNRFQLELNEP